MENVVVTYLNVCSDVQIFIFCFGVFFFLVINYLLEEQFVGLYYAIQHLGVSDFRHRTEPRGCYGEFLVVASQLSTFFIGGNFLIKLKFPSVKLEFHKLQSGVATVTIN